MNFSNDSSDFVVLTDVVPDEILEIRYFSTYNFVLNNSTKNIRLKLNILKKIQNNNIDNEVIEYINNNLKWYKNNKSEFIDDKKNTFI